MCRHETRQWMRDSTSGTGLVQMTAATPLAVQMTQGQESLRYLQRRQAMYAWQLAQQRQQIRDIAGEQLLQENQPQQLPHGELDLAWHLPRSMC